jgi:Right handed beta helix region
MRSAALGLGLAAVVAFMAIGATTASATHVQCGDVITQDTTLDSDVICPDGWESAGITIVNDDVTVDLAQHAVRAPSTTEILESNGIETDGPRRGLVVRNGSVLGFSTGVRLQASFSTAERMVLRNGSIGVFMAGDQNLVRRNRAYTTGFAPIQLRGDGFVVDRNVAWGGYDSCMIVRGDHPTVTRNDAGGCYTGGVSISNYTAALVARNRVTHSTGGLGVVGSGAHVEWNRVSHNYYGLDVSDPHAVVTRNVASDNVGDSGIEVFVAGATVSRNRADRNAYLGIDAVSGTIDGGGNRASGNGNPAQCVGVSCR